MNKEEIMESMTYICVEIYSCGAMTWKIGRLRVSHCGTGVEKGFVFSAHTLRTRLSPGSTVEVAFNTRLNLKPVIFNKTSL